MYINIFAEESINKKIEEKIAYYNINRTIREEEG
jgi:hypothetical protein